MNTLDIFYKRIVEEARRGRIDCLSFFNIIFATKIDDLGVEYPFISADEKINVGDVEIDKRDLIIPTLFIKNKEEFDRLLCIYVDKAVDFYDDSNFDDDAIALSDYNNEMMIGKKKIILARLFANATYEDFNDAISFLRKRISFFDNCLENINIGNSENIFNGKISIKVLKDEISNETPWQLLISAISEGKEEYKFPAIKFGILDDTVYIYAIQNDRVRAVSEYSKKINRLLYKIGEGYVVDDNEENLKDVTASFLVALNMGIAYFKRHGYSKIVVPSILIERWNGKCIANFFKAHYGKYNKETLDSEQVKLQYNLTNKMMRTFLRLCCHNCNLKVLSLPYENDSYLRIQVDDELNNFNNRLLEESYMLVYSDSKKKSR